MNTVTRPAPARTPGTPRPLPSWSVGAKCILPGTRCPEHMCATHSHAEGPRNAPRKGNLMSDSQRASPRTSLAAVWGGHARLSLEGLASAPRPTRLGHGDRGDDEHGVPVFPGQSLLQPPPPLPTPLPSPRAWQGPGEGETPAGGMALAASGQQRSFRGQFRTPSAVRGAVLMATGLQTLLGLFALGGPGNGAGRSAWPVRDSATCHPRHCGHGGGDTPRTRGCTWASARSSDGRLLPGADGV